MRVLEGRDAVRQRPAMYIGDKGKNGLHHLFYEILDNCIDEVLAGRASEVEVTINADKSVSVEDNGNGIPTGINSATGLSGVELAMTKLHGGGKFGDGGYKVSGGLHGVGLSCVNFLSLRCEALIEQNGGLFKFECEQGIPKGPVPYLKQIGEFGRPRHQNHLVRRSRNLRRIRIRPGDFCQPYPKHVLPQS